LLLYCTIVIFTVAWYGITRCNFNCKSTIEISGSTKGVHQIKTDFRGYEAIQFLMNSGFIFPVFLILSLFYSCKSPTPPVSGCDPGYLPCEEDNNHCCEVVCAVPYHNCGDQLTDCCLDTTSHIFNWNIYPLTDDGGSSFSRDAAILAPDDIWAIAYFNSPDTIDGEINPHYYSGAHWDGISWTPKEIPDGYINPAGEVDNAGIAEFQRCFIVDGNVWVTLLINTLTEIVESDYIFHTTSEQWDPYQVGYLVFGAWGTSSENIYLASHLGSILHYNGNDFTLIGATSYPCGITKITGTEDVVYFLANQKAPDLPGKYILAKYESGVLEEIYFGDNVTPDEEQFLGKIYSIWNWGDDL